MKRTIDSLNTAEQLLVTLFLFWRKKDDSRFFIVPEDLNQPLREAQDEPEVATILAQSFGTGWHSLFDDPIHWERDDEPDDDHYTGVAHGTITLFGVAIPLSITHWEYIDDGETTGCLSMTMNDFCHDIIIKPKPYHQVSNLISLAQHLWECLPPSVWKECSNFVVPLVASYLFKRESNADCTNDAAFAHRSLIKDGSWTDFVAGLHTALRGLVLASDAIELQTTTAQSNPLWLVRGEYVYITMETFNHATVIAMGLAWRGKGVIAYQHPQFSWVMLQPSMAHHADYFLAGLAALNLF